MKKKIKRIIKQCLSIGRDSINFAAFLVEMIFKSKLHNSFSRRYSGKVSILANGPSLKEVLPKLQMDKFSDTDFIVLNFFGMEAVFTRIKPKHDCLADPMFFSSKP